MKYLLQISLLLIMSLASCKTSTKVKNTDTTQAAKQVEDMDTPMGLIQKNIKLKELEGKKLFWVQTLYNDGSKSVPPEKRAYIIFKEEGNLQIQSICNMGKGSYTLSNPKSIELKAQMTTKIACDEPTVEYKYFQELNSASLVYQIGNKVFIELKMDTGSMEFEISE